MSSTPTTEDIRTAWAALVGSPEGFDNWLEQHHDKIMDIIDKETFHYGKTHYAGINCAVCRINGRIFLETTTNKGETE